MTGPDLVVLRGGLTLPFAAYRLAWDLEARGLRMGVDGDFLTVLPPELLTENDRAIVFDYVERLYKQIDGLVIHSLEVNSKGNFAVAAYMPTAVTVTDKN